jgi:hypothetical protein
MVGTAAPVLLCAMMFTTSCVCGPGIRGLGIVKLRQGLYAIAFGHFRDKGASRWQAVAQQLFVEGPPLCVWVCFKAVLQSLTFLCVVFCRCRLSTLVSSCQVATWLHMQAGCCSAVCIYVFNEICCEWVLISSCRFSSHSLGSLLHGVVVSMHVKQGHCCGTAELVASCLAADRPTRVRGASTA